MTEVERADERVAESENFTEGDGVPVRVPRSVRVGVPPVTVGVDEGNSETVLLSVTARHAVGL